MSEKDSNEPNAGDATPEARSVAVAGEEREAGTQPPGRQRAPVVVAVAALVIALGVAGGGGYGGWWLWQRFQEVRETAAGFVTESALEERAAAITGRTGELADRTGELGTRLDEVSARLRNLNEQTGARGDAIAEVRQRIESVQQDQKALASRMSEVEELARTSKEDWKRSEAAYLATVAIHRLRYYRDVDAALGALKEADDLLSDFGGQEITARKGIARAIDRLIEVDPPRIERILQRLEALRAQVDELPLASGPEPLQRTTGGEPPSMAGGGWRARAMNAWEQFTASLGQLVTISNERKVAPLRTPEERFFLAENLKLQIEAARMAALRGEQPAYARSVERLDEWLGTYFEAGDPAVADLRDGLGEIADAPVAVELPEIAPLLEPVRAFE